MKKQIIKYIDVGNGTLNSGDDYIEKCFQKEFDHYTLDNVGSNHIPLNDPSIIENGPIIMASSNMLRKRLDRFGNQRPGKNKGYIFQNIIPVSIGTVPGEKFPKGEFSAVFNVPNILLPLKLLAVILAYTLGPIVGILYSLLFVTTKAGSKRNSAAIDHNAPISCRTNEAKEYLSSLGIENTYVTGCVTMGSFNQKVIDSISESKKRKVIVAFTKEEIATKESVIMSLRGYYDEIIVGHQQYNYDSPVQGDRVISNDGDEYARTLKTGEYDYIGSRLHAGIFALKHGARGLFIAVDHRVRNYSKIFGLKYFEVTNGNEALTKETIESDGSLGLKPVNDEIIKTYKEKLDEYIKLKNKP